MKQGYEKNGLNAHGMHLYLSKAALASLFLSQLFLSLFTFTAEGSASCTRDHLPQRTSLEPGLNHPNQAKAAREHA
jgi:hypothetical protein